MSVFTEVIQPTSQPMMLRALCAAVGAIVVVDALAVQAPGLALLAVPFLIGAAALRQAERASSAAIAVLSALFVVVGVNLVVSNGFDAGWGDLLFAYLGTPLALAAGLTAAVRFRQLQRSASALERAVSDVLQTRAARNRRPRREPV
jgi:uncharacterized membrane protein YccC